MSIENYINILASRKEELKKNFNVKEIALFGSFARGEERKGSDLDVLVEFSVVPGLFKFIKLEDYLSAALGIKVDLIRKKAVRPELKESIFKDMITI